MKIKYNLPFIVYIITAYEMDFLNFYIKVNKILFRNIQFLQEKYLKE